MDKRRAGGSRLFLLFVLILIAAGMYLLNLHTPLMMDDYDYSFSWSTGERLTGVADVIASQAAHYRIWGGRSVAHTLVQLFLLWGKPLFNAANTLMYLLLLAEICVLARLKGWRIGGGMMLAAHLALNLLPFYGTVFLWLDGACNYLWCTALALLPLLILRSEREGGFFDAGWRHGLLAVPVFFLAGWTNENTACGVLAIQLLMAAYDRLIRRRSVRGWRIAALAAHALGTAVMLLAPGNFARASAEASCGLMAELVYRFAVVTFYTGLYTAILFALLGAGWLLTRKHGRSFRYEWTAILIGAGLLCAYALVGSPQISDRSFTGAYALVLAAALAALCDAGQGRRMSKPIRTALSAAAVVIFAAAISSVLAHERDWLGQVQAIEAAKLAGEEQVTVQSVPARSRYTMGIELGKTPEEWPNSTLGKYYGISIEEGL